MITATHTSQTLDMSRNGDRVVIVMNMCNAPMPLEYGHKCVKSRHPRTVKHECICERTWDEPVAD